MVVRLNDLSDADVEHMRRAMKLAQDSDNQIDGATARWADALAQSVAKWCEKNRARLAHRGPEITRVLAQYLGLSRTVATVERITGERFH